MTPYISTAEMLTQFDHLLPTLFAEWLVICSVCGIIGFLITHHNSRKRNNL